MASTRDNSIERLLARERWEDARKRLQKELVREPENHWLLTQLGVTYYEQCQYQEALRHFLAALEIVPDCPLTLWNLAGTLDALGKPDKAIPIYSWLLKSKKKPADDPCWESEEWTNSLKTDCVYRLGISFERRGRKASAERCFRQYINLLLAGMDGTYSLEDAAKRIRGLNEKAREKQEREVWRAIDSTLEDAEIPGLTNGLSRLPGLNLEELLTG